MAGKKSTKNKIYEMKYCKCGCGEKTKYSKLYHKPLDYIKGHEKA